MRTMVRLVTGTLVAAMFALPAGAVEQRPILTLDMALDMADACEAKAIEEGWRPVNIAIFDNGGNLKHFKRMDGAFVGSIEIAQLKGHTSAVFTRSTRAFGDFAYGGIGVSGATSDQDEECAQAGIDAVADRL